MLIWWLNFWLLISVFQNNLRDETVSEQAPLDDPTFTPDMKITSLKI